VDHQHTGDGLLIIALYVDNITIMGSYLEDVKQFKTEAFFVLYKMSDFGEIQSYLDIHIHRDCSQR
jgi:hypothetical protein